MTVLEKTFFSVASVQTSYPLLYIGLSLQLFQMSNVALSLLFYTALLNQTIAAGESIFLASLLMYKIITAKRIQTRMVGNHQWNSFFTFFPKI